MSSILLLAFGLVSTAAAFDEDLCYQNGDGLINCYDLVCEPGDDSPRCLADAVVDTGRIGNGGRSSVHVDATYYIAQAVGLDSETAYWIGAYSEATDLTRYFPADEDGVSFEDVCDEDGDDPDICDYVTVEIDGLDRNDYSTGGVLLHFPVPHSHSDGPVDGIDGKAPDVSDASQEKVLAQLRDWAFGDVDNICVGGFTGPTGCAADAADITGTMPVLTVGGAFSLDAALGEQIIDEGRTAMGDVYGDLSALFDDEDDSIQRDAARVGIYLHSLQDRISHSVCTDASYSTRALSGDVTVSWDTDACSQPIHLLRHAWEVGVDQSALPAQEQTTRAAIEATYDELLAYATASGTASAFADTDAYRDAVIETMMGALGVEGAADRVSAFMDANTAAGFPQMHGLRGEARE